MEDFEMYRIRMEKIKDLIILGNYTEAIFDCKNINTELKKLYNNKPEILRIINETNNILRKYDYDHQNVFDENDAKEMFYDTLNILKIIRGD